MLIVVGVIKLSESMQKVLRFVSALSQLSNYLSPFYSILVHKATETYFDLIPGVWIKQSLLIKFDYFFKCNNYFEIRHLDTFWIQIGKRNLDKHWFLRRCSFLYYRLSTDFGRIIAESTWEAEDSHLWSDKQIQIFTIL